MLTEVFLGAPLWMWAFTTVTFLGFIFLDLFGHTSHSAPSVANAAMWAGFSVVLMLIHAVLVWHFISLEGATKMLTAYVIEMALSTDNLFAIAAIMAGFGLNAPSVQYMQHKILLWGILGAIGFRLVLLGTITYLTNLLVVNVWGQEVNILFVVFALIIAYTAVKMLKHSGEPEEVDFTNHWSVRFTKKFTARVDDSITSGRFFTAKGVTPLFFCLVCVEAMDLVFAVDSIPVVVGIIKDNFYLVFTASMGAVLCLRNLYFVLLASRNSLWALEKAIVGLLGLVALKLAYAAIGGHFDPLLGLGVTLAVLTGGIVVSLLWPQPLEEAIHRHHFTPRQDPLKLDPSLFAARKG